jgi:hypothetical protein
MRIQPRRQLLQIWRATVASSLGPDGEWLWGGRDGSNSISDAEQLLCLMLPATEIPRFRVDGPDETDNDVLDALRGLGDAVEIPRRLVRAVVEYLKRYTLDDEFGTPSFAGGSYAVPKADNHGERAEPTKEQLALDVVEGYASSITLMLCALGFAKVFRTALSRTDLLAEVDELERLANKRLSAAMIGLLRSFSVKVFPVDSESGQVMLQTVNQSGVSRRKVLSALHLALRDTAAGLRDLDIGLAAVDDLENPERLFECGWSWGPTLDAPPVTFQGEAGTQRDGYASDEPYLYFTVVALDAIADLFSERTRVLGLVSDDQSRLADALRKRWDLTQRYWGTIASLGPGRWPLEDIPWRTTDGGESDFFSLLVTSIAARNLAALPDKDADLIRIGELLTELANRGRVIRRPLATDTAIGMHHPGVAFELYGMQAFGPPLDWIAADFAPLLLKRAIRVAQLISDVKLRGHLLRLANGVWRHVEDRRIGNGLYRNLWDQPENVFPAVTGRSDRPSWHHTVRVVESLVLAASLISTFPLRSEPLAAYAEDLLAEAEHLYDQELLAGSAGAGRPMRDRMEWVSQRLDRCREIMDDRPASATAVLTSVLQELDALAVARQDVVGAA